MWISNSYSQDQVASSICCDIANFVCVERLKKSGSKFLYNSKFYVFHSNHTQIGYSLNIDNSKFHIVYQPQVDWVLAKSPQADWVLAKCG